MEPRHSELRSLSHIRRGVGEKAKMLPPMRLPPFRGSDVMPETVSEHSKCTTNVRNRVGSKCTTLRGLAVSRLMLV